MSSNWSHLPLNRKVVDSCFCCEVFPRRINDPIQREPRHVGTVGSSERHVSLFNTVTVHHHSHLVVSLIVVQNYKNNFKQKKRCAFSIAFLPLRECQVNKVGSIVMRSHTKNELFTQNLFNRNWSLLSLTRLFFFFLFYLHCWWYLVYIPAQNALSQYKCTQEIVKGLENLNKQAL